VDPTVRVTLTATITSCSISNNPTFTFQLYLDGSGNALELGADNLQITSGPAYLQQAQSSGFEGPYAIRVYGYSNNNALPAMSAVGPVTVASNAFSGYTDQSLQNSNNSASNRVAGSDWNRRRERANAARCWLLCDRRESRARDPA
jgi:hypothetical protein